MTTENIFSGLKVVDLASFIAGPAAAVILSDFGADVIKVEPPSGDLWRMGYKIPPQPRATDNYPWHLNNRNKRGLTLDLKSPGAQAILERLVRWADVLIVNTPHPARRGDPEADLRQRPGRGQVLTRGGQPGTGDEPGRGHGPRSVAVRALRGYRRQRRRHAGLSAKARGEVQGSVNGDSGGNDDE